MAIAWLHSNVARVDSMPVRHEPGFKNALSTMQRLKRAEGQEEARSDSTTFFILVFMALGIQAGGSPTTSTHLKNGMTTEDNTGKPVF